MNTLIEAFKLRDNLNTRRVLQSIYISMHEKKIDELAAMFAEIDPSHNLTHQAEKLQETTLRLDELRMLSIISRDIYFGYNINLELFTIPKGEESQGLHTIKINHDSWLTHYNNHTYIKTDHKIYSFKDDTNTLERFCYFMKNKEKATQFTEKQEPVDRPDLFEIMDTDT